MTAKRKKAERRGRFAEYLAAAHLMLRGWSILSLRYKTARGELDIIAKKRDVIAICEVKARKNAAAALEAVDLRTQKRISAAARIWLAANPFATAMTVRFDIIAVALPFSVRWHKNAFDEQG